MKRVLKLAVFLLMAILIAAPLVDAASATYSRYTRYTGGSTSGGSTSIPRYSSGGSSYYRPIVRWGYNRPATPTQPSQPAPPTEPTEPTTPTQPAPPTTPAPPAQPAPNPGTGNTGVTPSAEEMQMLAMVNAERAKAGVAPLEMDPALVRLARMKSQDMVDNRYFSHYSPTYGSPFEMLKSAGISYRTAGENIAKAGTVDTAHNALMKSDGHRANIMSSIYKKVGIGIVNTGTGKMITQLFVG